MNCPSKNYPFSPAIAQAAVAKIRSSTGFAIDPNQPSGTAKDPKHGVVVCWTVKDENINIFIVSKPWYISCDSLYGHLDELFDSIKESKA